MRYLILSDMHANWDAFEAVLRRARRKRFDAVLVLGDLVGYGAAPNQVVEAVRALGPKLYTVRGNHDKVVAGIDRGANFNQSALIARHLARLTGLPVDNHALLRTRRTRPLRGMSPKTRAKAVRGAFALAPGHMLKGRAVLLIDDVQTSGATAAACARASVTPAP